jgi:hypothetical protein
MSFSGKGREIGFLLFCFGSVSVLLWFCFGSALPAVSDGYRN